MSNHYTGPFSFNLLASQEEVAVIHDGRVMLLENPKLSSMNVHYDAGYETIYSTAGPQQLQSTPKKIELELRIVATEYTAGDQESINLPKAVDDMTVEELLAAVNQKIEDRQ